MSLWVFHQESLFTDHIGIDLAAAAEADKGDDDKDDDEIYKVSVRILVVNNLRHSLVVALS